MPAPLLLALAALAAAPAAAPAAPRTFRLDYFHSGSATEERFAVDRLVLEPLPFPGNPDRPVDDTGLGKYLFEVRAPQDGRLLYSRGFSSIYGEWETTGEARERWRTFHESLRFPRPGGPVRVVVKKRDAHNVFQEVWSTAVDPAAPDVDDAPPAPVAPVLQIHRGNAPGRALDLLILGDGYTASQRGRCEADARRLTAALLAQPPFRDRPAELAVRALCPAARAAGVSRPSTGLHRDSPFGASYDAFGTERYVLSFENRRVRDAASWAPYDALAIMVNSATYGGGGIFNLYATVAAGSRFSPYIFVHELGHALAGLADEYFTSDTAYLPEAERVEPWEPNVTARADPARLKWRALVTPGTPVPTPWREDAYARRAEEFQAERQRIRATRAPEAEMDALFLRQEREETAFLAAEAHHGQVGAFEGANYQAHGFYRAELDCIMFTRDRVPFCGPCRAALGAVLDLDARPAPAIGGGPAPAPAALPALPAEP